MRGHVWLEEQPVAGGKVPAVPCLGGRILLRGPRGGVADGRIVADLFLAVAVKLGNDAAREKVRWFVMGNGDTVFFLDNLVAVLRKYDHEERHYVGGAVGEHGAVREMLDADFRALEAEARELLVALHVFDEMPMTMVGGNVTRFQSPGSPYSF
jgi:hypothetical protein